MNLLSFKNTVIIPMMAFLPLNIWAQNKTYIQPHKGLRGNTAFRGNILPDKEDKIVNNDFFIIQFRALNTCTVLVDQMEIADSGKIYRLKPLFLDMNTEMRVTAGETISVRAEKDNMAQEVVSDTPANNIFYKGKLAAKVNGKEVVLMVKDFENIFTSR